jgi:hypothetical protein
MSLVANTSVAGIIIGKRSVTFQLPYSLVFPVQVKNILGESQLSLLGGRTSLFHSEEERSDCSFRV